VGGEVGGGAPFDREDERRRRDVSHARPRRQPVRRTGGDPTDANIRRDVAHAHHILSTILCARREVGDRSRIAEIAANVESLVAPTRSPDDNEAEWIARIRATTAQRLALP
jgi:hypothetical protein